jgi:hypothetical protein
MESAKLATATSDEINEKIKSLSIKRRKSC